MIIKRIIAIAAVVFSFVTPAGAEVTIGDVQKAIPKTLSHPYLYFTEADKPAIIERIKNDPEANEIFRRLEVEGRRLIFTPVEVIAPVEPRNPRYDTDGVAIRYVNVHRNAALLLAFLYQMTGDEKYAQKSFEFTDTLCDLRSWTYRAHEFPIIYSRVWPWGCKDDQIVFTYDIRTGDMAYELGMVYDWLYPALDKHQRDRIRSGLLENAITHVRGNWEYHWWASAYRCNWCGIGLAGLGVSSLALLTEDPQLVDVIAESYNRMEKHLNELGVDGGWQEGRSYWAYGMRSSIFFIEAMKYITADKLNLYNNKRLHDNPADFALYGLTGYFGDGSGSVVGSTHLLNLLMRETKDSEAAWYRDNMLGKGSTMFDILWPKPVVKAVEPSQKSKHFRTIDWVVMRSDFKAPETVTVATKAGYNNDPHHGHLDIGQVMVNWQNEYYIADLGSGRYFYDEKYFDEIRWEYPQASSVGHNVVFVDGEQQISAKYKNKPWREGIGGKILEFRQGKNRDYTYMDPSGAYPGIHLKGWRRHIILEKPVVTVILDEVSSDPGAEIEARFHSGVTADVRDDFVLLTGRRGKMALVTATEGDIDYRSGKHPYLPVIKTASFQWIPYFGSVTKASGTSTLLATVIMPVDSDDAASSIARTLKVNRSGNGGTTVSFTAYDKTYSYEFKATGDGMVLR